MIIPDHIESYGPILDMCSCLAQTFWEIMHVQDGLKPWQAMSWLHRGGGDKLKHQSPPGWLGEFVEFVCMSLGTRDTCMYIYTDKTSLKADREVGGGRGMGRADSVSLFRNL